MSGYTTTPNLGLKKPIVGADDDAWGGHLNENADVLDAIIKAIETNPGFAVFDVRYYGAKLDGVTDDSAAFTAAFQATPAYATIYVPPGNVNLGTFAPTSKQVFWNLSGNYSGTGTAPIIAIGNNVLESFLATGGKYFVRGSTTGMSTLGGVVRVDMTANHAGGTPGGLPALQVNLASTAASSPGQSLIAGNFNVTLRRTSDTITSNGVAIQAAAVRALGAGNTQIFGGNIYADDQSELPSSEAGSAVGVEFDLKGNGLDDGVLADGYNNSGVGTQPGSNRIGLDIKIGRSNRALNAPFQVANVLNMGVVDSDPSWTSVKNAIAARYAIDFAGLNFRQSTFGASANGVLFQVGANATLAWTADALNTTSTNYATIRGTGTGANLGIELNPIGTGRVKFVGGKLNMAGIATSATGLVSGDVWSNAGVLTVVA